MIRLNEKVMDGKNQSVGIGVEVIKDLDVPAFLFNLVAVMENFLSQEDADPPDKDNDNNGDDIDYGYALVEFFNHCATLKLEASALQPRGFLQPGSR
jgi:hypothetical protein